MKKSTIDNLKFYLMITIVSLLAAGLYLVFFSSPLIRPEEIPAFKQWLFFNR
jgi:hypothetical protein